MTTMQNMSCMMRNSASATCADAATSCAYTAGMQSASTSIIIMMGAMIMASIIICSGLIMTGRILGSLHLVILLALVLLGIIIKVEKTQRP